VVGHDFNEPSERQFYQDNATEQTRQAYSSNGRTPEVVEVLASYGFTDFSQVDNSSPSPCFEMAVRDYCSELKRDPGAYPLPSVAQVAAEIRAAAAD
jgi:hypothetical protein